MELQPRGYKKVVQLIDKGATIPNPSSLHVGDEVNLSRIAAKGLTIYPGCRIYGEGTVLSQGVVLGAEGPVTLEDCALGPQVELKGGYFRQSVFLDKASVGSGAQVREACLIEEEACGAHAVGLKQTILFPFATVGSLVNFCDCLLAGGTSRTDHSEVGSGYVHFNYTPDGDKATASLFGDVPRGVMLNQPPIFLGGQGGAVGPVRVSFGTVLAAGSILRDDVTEERLLVCARPAKDARRGHIPFAYKNLGRVVRNNVTYLANLVALEEWYRMVRQDFFRRQDLGEAMLAAALGVLSAAKEERAKRLKAMVENALAAGSAARVLAERVDEVCAAFGSETVPQLGPEGEGFLNSLQVVLQEGPGGYIDTIRSLAPSVATHGVMWLQNLVDELCRKADVLLQDTYASEAET
jgi:bifunctional UDP-N-acetylglucosamine pyrophosphorylase/glucosamine-1-phosphate N-acetyltransferase